MQGELNRCIHLQFLPETLKGHDHMEKPMLRVEDNIKINLK